MTDKQWDDLNRIIKGDILDPLPVGFIIDCPWLPNWYGISILDYFSNDEIWYKSNKYVGGDFVIAGIIVTLSSFILLLFRHQLTSIEITLTGTILMIVPIIIILIRGFHYLKKVP